MSLPKYKAMPKRLVMFYTFFVYIYTLKSFKKLNYSEVPHDHLSRQPAQALPTWVYPITQIYFLYRI